MPRQYTPHAVLTCAQCFTTFTVPSNIADKSRFCSRACWRSWVGRRTLECTCAFCGTTFRRKPSQVKRGDATYCSRACHSSSMRQPLNATCEICGVVFPVTFNRHIQRRYCSMKCFGKAQAEVARQRNLMRPRPLWSDDDVAYIKEHYATDGVDAVALAVGKTHRQVIHKAHTLGLKMTSAARKATTGAASRRLMIANNPMKREDVRQKVAAWHRSPAGCASRLRLIQAQSVRNRTRPSGRERRVAAMLDALGLAFEPSAYIKPNFIVDFRLGRLILEADGDWWHGHPRFAPLNPRQLAQQRRDAARDAYLTTCGYTVLRIWESDLSIDSLRHLLGMRPAALL